MRADICDPDDDDAVERFKASLKQMGAVLTESHKTSLGDIWHFKIGNDKVIVFADSWSIDVEGPEASVNQLLLLFDPGQEAGD